LLNGNLREIEIILNGIRNNTIKSLIVLSRFLGIHKEFKQRLDDYGVKVSEQDAFTSFMRIYNNNSADLLKWYKDAFYTIRTNEQIFLESLALTGTRKEEAITSFNKILELNKIGNLSEYYILENNVLEDEYRKSIENAT
jgi:hypothetical protein